MKEKQIEVDKIQRIAADEIISLDRQYYGVEPDRALAKMEAYQVAEKLYEAGYRKQSEGEWIYHECVSSYDGIKSGYSCSKCSAFVDEEVFDTDEFHKKHCGNCGAKMKGGEG